MIPDVWITTPWGLFGADYGSTFILAVLAFVIVAALRAEKS